MPERQPAYADASAKLTIGAKVIYDAYCTHYMHAGGAIAYCGVPAKATPQGGTYPITPLRDVPDIDPIYIASALWFGYGGPGFDRSIWPSRWADGTPMTDDRYLALQHIVLADLYAQNSVSALKGCSSSFKEWVASTVLTWWEGVYSDNRTQTRIYERRNSVPKDFANGCYCMFTGANTQVIISFTPGGWIDLKKASADPEMTDGNACYSLQAAEYGVFRDNGCTDRAATLTLDAAAYAKSGYLSAGTYYVRETKAPTGYALDGRVYSVAVNNGQTTRVGGKAVTDAPQCGVPEMLAAKIDLETHASDPQGGASLAGAEFTIRYYDGYYATAEEAEASGGATRIWVVRTDQNGRALLSDAHRVEPCDGFYRAGDGRPAVPLGTLLIQETKAPEGYHLSDAAVYACQVQANGTAQADVGYRHPVVADQIYRGDLKLVKVRESNQDRLSGIPFRITDNKTGEAHVIVTDANGEASTCASWAPHSRNTNINDEAVSEGGAVDASQLDAAAGTWFGTAVPDDSKGALMYSSYSIEELPVAANEGLALIRIPQVVIDEREGHVVDLGTLSDKALPEVQLTTYAREQRTGGKTAPADPATKIIDRVRYSGLDASLGIAYELHAALMDARSGQPIADASGEPVTGYARFVPKQSNGYAEVPLAFDSRTAAGHDVCVFERMVRCDTGETVAAHEDADDYDQTIYVTGPVLSTSAADAADGDRAIAAEPEAQLVDNVSYRNLVAGDEYTLVGSLHMKSTEVNFDGTELTVEPLLDTSGEPCRTSIPFVAEAADGTVEVRLPCDLTAAAGAQVVIFESLYKNGELIARHESAADMRQTLDVLPPQISTVASDALDGNETVAADADAQVVDAISYAGLAPGTEYRLEGQLMRRIGPTGSATALEAEPVTDASGEPVCSRTTFTPEAGSGRTEVRFAFDASELAGEDLVVFESLYRDDVLIAQDDDPANMDQSFNVRAMSAWTQLAGPNDEDKTVEAAEAVSFEDAVSYADATPGSRYTVYGMLLDARTGAPLLRSGNGDDADGQEASALMEALLYEAGAAPGTIPEMLSAAVAAEGPRTFDESAFLSVLADHPDLAERLVTAQTSFTAESTAGDAALAYRLDARGLEGREATSVIAVARDDQLICAEADLGSEAQTVTFATRDKRLPGTGYDKTGDESWVAIAFCALAAATACAAAAYGIRQTMIRNRRAEESMQRALRRN